MQKQHFGGYIRELREGVKMPLRKLAAKLDIDTSTLSKIERQERNANSEMVPILAEAFNLDFKELQIMFWTDKLINELKGEEFIIESLENTLEYLKTNSR